MNHQNLVTDSLYSLKTNRRSSITALFTVLTKLDTLHQLYSAINTKAHDWHKVVVNKHVNNGTVMTAKLQTFWHYQKMKITFMKKANGNGGNMVQSNSEYHTFLSAVYR